jgi:hypothetical protein
MVIDQGRNTTAKILPPGDSRGKISARWRLNVRRCVDCAAIELANQIGIEHRETPSANGRDFGEMVGRGAVWTSPDAALRCEFRLST